MIKAEEFKELDAAIECQRGRVVRHPVYSSLESVECLKVFMEHHVFAVWDFMTLLKRLQRDATSTEIAWRPRGDARMRRMINEIVLGEETDEIAPGKFLSHLELYIEAMEEVGADTTAITAFLLELGEGTDPELALERSGAPLAARRFSSWTWRLAYSRGIHEVAAAFFYGREDLIPDMFRSVLDDLGGSCPMLRLYLERHIELDEGEHGPLAKELLGELCGEVSGHWQEIRHAALHSLKLREELWDGVLSEIRALLEVSA
jgi:hypothetical protein